MGYAQKNDQQGEFQPGDYSAIPRKTPILIVDDEESICSSLQSVLEDEGFAAAVATNGREALMMVEEYNPKVVFLDIWMPGSDGIETLKQIKQLSPSTEVIMISGHATIANALEATKRGAFDFIEKPLGIDSVLFSLSRALDRHGREEIAKHTGGPVLRHPGAFGKLRAGRNVGQRTIRSSTVLYGQCLHSGQKSGLVLEPLPPNSGIHFSKMGDSRTVPAYVDFVQSTNLATTIRDGLTHAMTIEHLLSALHAYRISNLLVKCNGEVPIFDGSAREFCSVFETLGIEEQGGEWFEIAPEARLEQFVAEKNGSREEIVIEPLPEGEEASLIVRYELNYSPPVGRQVYEFRHTGPESFRKEISDARTFGFMRDVERMQRAGLAAGGRLDNFILIGSDGVVNTELRYPDELVRHKILDILGDLFLIGRPLRAKITARMTGHSDNIALLKQMSEHLSATA